MSTNKPTTLRNRLNSFRYAFAGILKLLEEPNMRIHVCAAIAVVILGFVRDISRSDWMLLAFAIALVWVAEAVNTALEHLCDLISGGKYHSSIKVIKDISAAAVLIAATASVVIGCLIFL